MTIYSIQDFKPFCLIVLDKLTMYLATVLALLTKI